MLRYLIKCIIGKCIEFIERIETRNSTIFDNKFIDRRNINKTIKTDTGYVNATTIYKTKPYQVYEVIFTDGSNIEGADEHILFTDDLKEICIKDLKNGDKIKSKSGNKVVKEIIKYPYKLCMYDITVDSENHRYYTSDVLSHNTTTTAAYITWYVCFHSDRNVGIMANKQDTAIEIVSKVKDMIVGLPYFLQPGVLSWGQKGCAFDNGCKIISSATTKSASIGFTMNGILYLDEFAHIEPSICDSFWRSVYPTLSSSKTSQLIISSTPNGPDNQFAKIWFGSQNKENSFVGLRVDYWRVPGHDEKWAEEQKRNFGEEFFNQEFLLQFSSASSSLLKGKDFEFMQKIQKEYETKHIIKDTVYLDDEEIKWHPWFDPNNISESDRFVFALDTAGGDGDLEMQRKEGKKSVDFNTLLIFQVLPNSGANMRRFRMGGVSLKDAFRFVEIGRFMRNNENEEYLANVAAELALDIFNAYDYDNVRMMVEMNFEGNSFVRTVMNHPKFFDDLIVKTYHKTPIPGEKLPPKKYGFLTNGNKTQFCVKGKELVGKKRIIITDIKTQDQLKAFGWVKGKLKGISMHDDLSYPAINHIPRFLEDDYCMQWLEDWLCTKVDPIKRNEINNVLEMYAPEDAGLSEEEFNFCYGMNDSNYGSGMFSGYSSNPFGGTNDPYIGGNGYRW